MAEDAIIFPLEEETEEEQAERSDVCRVCRLEEDEDNPMVHPCKCSGSVRYVHPDCLKNWLAMSGKKACEICGHKYTFTKVYPDYLPSFIPPTVYIRQSIRWISRTVMYFHRCWVVVCVWLIVLPLANMGGLKTFSWFADYTIAGLVPPTTAEQLVNSTSLANITLQEVSVNLTSPFIPSTNHTKTDILEFAVATQLPGIGILKLLWQHYRQWSTSTPEMPSPQIRFLFFPGTFNVPSPYYIFQGQILSVALAVLIIALIFLREWFSSYNWADHDPAPQTEMEEIDPDDWEINDGQAKKIRMSHEMALVGDKEALRRLLEDQKMDVKIYDRMTGERLPDQDKEENRALSGKEVNGSSPETGLTRFPSAPAEAGDMRMPQPTLARSTSSPGTVPSDDIKPGQPSSNLPYTLRPPPLNRKFSNLEIPSDRKIDSDESSTSTIAESAEAGPGPSTLITRLSRPTSPIIPLSELIEENRANQVKYNALLRELDALRRARARLAEGRTESSTWKAPELLVSKGKGRAVDPQVAQEDGAPVSAGRVDEGSGGVSAPVSPAVSRQVSSLRPNGSTRGTRAVSSPVVPQVLSDVDDEADDDGIHRHVNAGLDEQKTQNPVLLRRRARKILQHTKTQVDAYSGILDQWDTITDWKSWQTRRWLNEKRKDFGMMPSNLQALRAELGLADMSNELGEILEDKFKESSYYNGYRPEEGEENESDYNPLAYRSRPKHNKTSSLDTQATGAREGHRTTSPTLNHSRETSSDVDADALRARIDDLMERHERLEEKIEQNIGRSGLKGRQDWHDPKLTSGVVRDTDEKLRYALERLQEAGMAVEVPEPESKLNGGPARAKPEGLAEPAEPIIEAVMVQPEPEAEVAVVNNVVEAELDGDEAEVVFEEDEEDDGVWEAGDWDQILEVIGLVGPYSALFQNLVLAIAIMGAAMTTFVLLPQTLGKVFLCIDPVRSILAMVYSFWKVAKLILRWTRFLTDPIIDIGLEIGKEVVWKPAGVAFWGFERILARKLGLERVVSSAERSGDGHVMGSMKRWMEGLTRPAQPKKLDNPLFGRNIAILPSYILEHRWSPLNFLRDPHKDVNPTMEVIIDNIALLGNKSYHAYEAYRTHSVRLATSDKLGDGMACLAIGYLVGMLIMLGLAWLGESGRVKVAEGWKVGLRRYRLFVKLSGFLALELVAFPLATGALMTLCTLPLFPDGTIHGRFDHMREMAFGVVLLTWLIGTMFMYAFAQVLVWARSFCRSGALYFIRDPHDRHYSAVKEMIDRPTGIQFYKLALSSMLYSFLVFWLFGAIPWGIRYFGPKDLLPLRLDRYGPLSPIPFDYLFLLIAVPPTLQRLRPQHTMKKLLKAHWYFFTHLTRLEHLLYGVSYQTPPPITPGRMESLVWAVLDIPFRWLFGSYPSSATLARVPAQDKISIFTSRHNLRNGRREGMFIPLDSQGRPKNPEDKLKLLRQDAIARQAGREPEEDFRIVYLPERWRTRVHVFILCLLVSGGAALGLAVLGPVSLGRDMLKGRFGEVHDGYSFLVGAYTSYATIYLGNRVRRIILSLNRAPELRLSTRQTLIKRFFLNILRRAVAVVMIYLVQPVLWGLLVEIRLGLLVRHGMSDSVPVIHLWDAWALGAVLNSIELGACGLFGRHRGEDAHRMHVLWRRPFLQKLGDVVGQLLPEYGSLLFKISLPYLLTLLLTTAMEMDDNFRMLQFRTSGLTTWFMYTLVTHFSQLMRKASDVRQNMIDAEYVVEERVENYEPEPESASPTEKENKEAINKTDGAVIPPPAVLRFDNADIDLEEGGFRNGRILVDEIDMAPAEGWSDQSGEDETYENVGDASREDTEEDGLEEEGVIVNKEE